MPHAIEASTLRILKPTGETVGTGFLVSKNLAVTCAHVVKILGARADDTIDIRFTGKSAVTTARVLPEYWQPDDATDIAILQIDDIPIGVFPLRMGRASESRLKNTLYTFGYAIAADEQGIGGLGTFITLKQDGNFIQFRMHEANHGHSGAPIYDDQRGVVVGMVKKGHTGTGRNAETTFAIPTETIWQICPDLRPVIPPLPRCNPIVEGINLLPYDYDQRIQNFLTEYLGTDSHPVPFGGRDKALQMLDTWLADAAPYLLLAAPAGRGKSALLVRWLDSLKDREDLALAFVPISIRFGTNMERVFYAALAARLAFLHGDDVPASPETSTAVYRGLVSDYLSKPLANGRTLLVVLDGLDEAADWRTKADFMPAELPAGVRVVVSARFLAGDADSKPWLGRLNWERNGLASAPSLTPLDRAGVADVLLKMSCPLDELSRKVDIVAELYRLSEGDPLLVGLYVGDLWSKGKEVSRLKTEDLADIQPGYKGYFDRWWDDQKELWGRQKPWLEKRVRTVRNILAGALGPLFVDDLQALDPELETDYLADALDVLQRFIIGDNESQGYTFSHPKLGQYFWEILSETERAQWEGRFLAWGEQTLQEFIDGKRDPTKKKEVPFYAVNSYGTHLARANQPIEKWLPLIHHQQWAQAWFTVEGAYGGYLQDVQRVWEQCRILDRQAIRTTEKASYLGQQIRCALIEASLHSLAENVPAKLIPILVKENIWTLSQAWTLIRQMPDNKQKADTIIALISYLNKPQLLQALEATRTIQTEYERAVVLSILAEHLPDAAREALETARAIRDERKRTRLLSTLAQFLPDIVDEALESARAIRDESERATVLSILSKCIPDVAKEALEVVRVIQKKRMNSMPDRMYRASLLSELAQYLPDLYSEAQEATQDIKNEVSQQLFFLSKQAQQVDANSIENARIESERHALFTVFVHRLPPAALEPVLQAVQASQYTWLMSKLAQRLPTSMLGSILESARAIRDESERALVLSTLAQRLPEISREALEAARQVRNSKERVGLLSDLASHLRWLATEAFEESRVIQDSVSHASMLSALAQYLPEAADEAIKLARAIENEKDRAPLLSKLTQYLPENTLELGREAAREIRNEKDRASVLCDLAHRLPDAANEAIEIAQAIQDEGDRAHLLRDLAQRLPEAALKVVLENAREIQDVVSRFFILKSLAERLPETVGEALETARAIQDEESRALLFIGWMECLPDSGLGHLLKDVLTIKKERVRAMLLGKLAKRLPQAALGPVLEAAQAIQDEEARAQLAGVLAQQLADAPEESLSRHQTIQGERPIVMSPLELIKRLPETPLGTSVAIMQDTISISEASRAMLLCDMAQDLPKAADEALKAAQKIQNEEFRVRVLCALAQQLPNATEPALEATQAIQDERYRACMFIALVQPLINTSLKRVYLCLETTLDKMSMRKRSNLFSDISALLPVFINLGVNEVDMEIYSAVRDVTTWWP